ncbi:hypothetical protein SLS62_002963 [Diatrype stigma]|uniref:NTF2 domain-containing protein n=1 Tax=Diatrype stigma TaxID=117547 RepID=A0AAN9YQE8_9PEZI
MAALPSLETQAKVASDAAQNFVEHYYEALNRRHNLAQYYASASSKLAAADVKPDISINGNVCASVADFEDLLNKQGSPVYCNLLSFSPFPPFRHEVISYDAQPVNPHFTLGAPASSASSEPDRNERKAIEAGERLSVALQVAGTVRYGKAGDEGTVERTFTEAWLLVPHWEALARQAPRGLRRWVVASQNFRAF